MKCASCGTELKEVEVRVAIRKWVWNDVSDKPEYVFDRYEKRTEYADCPRCTGGY